MPPRVCLCCHTLSTYLLNHNCHTRPRYTTVPGYAFTSYVIVNVTPPPPDPTPPHGPQVTIFTFATDLDLPHNSFLAGLHMHVRRRRAGVCACNTGWGGGSGVEVATSWRVWQVGCPHGLHAGS